MYNGENDLYYYCIYIVEETAVDYGHRRSPLNHGIGYTPDPLYSHPCSSSVCTVIRTTEKSLNTNRFHANRIVTTIPVAAHLPHPAATGL